MIAYFSQMSIIIISLVSQDFLQIFNVIVSYRAILFSFPYLYPLIYIAINLNKDLVSFSLYVNTETLLQKSLSQHQTFALITVPSFFEPYNAHAILLNSSGGQHEHIICMRAARINKTISGAEIFRSLIQTRLKLLPK